MNSWRPSAAEFRRSGVVEPAGRMPPININVRFLQGPRDWRWLWLGPWPSRFSGGFVLSYRAFALGAGFGRYVWRWFRLIGRDLGRQCPGSIKPLELARDRLAARFWVRHCSGLFPSLFTVAARFRIVFPLQ